MSMYVCSTDPLCVFDRLEGFTQMLVERNNSKNKNADGDNDDSNDGDDCAGMVMVVHENKGR